jgi:NitT/TauT family transport system permease protein
VVASLSDQRQSLIPAHSITLSRETKVLRLLSFVVFLATWWTASLLAGGPKLPSPPVVLTAMIAEASSGALFFNLGVTLARVALAFTLAMTLGVAIGYLMGRVQLANRVGDPWLILLTENNSTVVKSEAPNRTTFLMILLQMD